MIDQTVQVNLSLAWSFNHLVMTAQVHMLKKNIQKTQKLLNHAKTNSVLIYNGLECSHTCIV